MKIETILAELPLMKAEAAFFRLRGCGRCVIITTVEYMTQKNKNVIEIPAEVWAGATTLEDIEDWLIANDPESVAALTEARAQHLRGELISLEEIQRRLDERAANG